METIRDYSDVVLLLTGNGLEIHDDVEHAIELYNQLGS
jgi:hypothetical protein